MSQQLPTDELGWHRWFAVDYFNHTWTFLDSKEELTQEQKDAMLASALASRLHWGKVGTPMNFAIGDWQIARVYATLGDAAQAIHYGERSLALSNEHDLGPFCVGYANEAIARGKKLADDQTSCDEHIQLASACIKQIDDEHDRKLLADDLKNLKAD